MKQSVSFVDFVQSFVGEVSYWEGQQDFAPGFCHTQINIQSFYSLFQLFNKVEKGALST